MAEVVATLTLVQDVTANAALLTLLAGPRWAIGPRDLALLGRRAADLVRHRGRISLADVRRSSTPRCPASDPAEVASLGDALESTRATATTRPRRGAGSGCWPRSCAGCGRRWASRSSTSSAGSSTPAASTSSWPRRRARPRPPGATTSTCSCRRSSEFQAVDGQVTLAALLAWLEAEDELGQGLDVATPSEADSVKLLTVHRAKGLEWDVVFIPGVTERKFPTDRTRSTWLTVPFVMPGRLRGDARDRPVLAGHTPDDIAAFPSRPRSTSAIEELRLAYVAWTRARHRLPVRGWCFPPTSRAAAAPRSTSATVRRRWPPGAACPSLARPAGRRTPPTPMPRSTRPALADVRTTPPEVARRHDAAAWSPVPRRRWPPARRGRPDRRHAGARPHPGVGRRARPGSLEEASRDRSPAIDVPLPSSLSATALARLRDDPEAFAADLARPMPRQPSPAARFGTRFHAWVEARFGQQDLLRPRRPAGPRRRRHRRRRRPAGADRRVRGRRRSPTGSRTRSRRRSRWCSPARWCAAGSTRSTPRPDGDGCLVVDWKTNRAQTPTRCSSRSTAWPGPSSPACRSSGCARSSTSCAPATSSSRADLPGRAELEKVLASRRRLSHAPSAAASAISTISPNVCSRSAAVVSSPVTMWSETVQIASARRPCLAASV